MNSTGALAQLRQGDRPAGLSAEIDSVALLLMELLGRLSLTTRIAAIDRVRTRLDALEVSSLACQMIDADDLRQARRLATTSRRSRRQIERVVQRASVVKRNGDLQVELDQGTLTAEQLDVISSASRRSGGSAASDADLVRRITSVSPDQGRKVADRWLTERLRAADLDAAHTMRREQRHAHRGRSADGLPTITLAGDDVTIEQAWSSITALAERFYKQDGGREVPTAQHRRTSSQRLYDAAIEQLTGGSSETAPWPPQVVLTVDAGPVSVPGSQPVDPSQLAERLRTGSPIARTSGEVNGELLGAGPIAPSELERILCDCALSLLITDPGGQPLWLGRTRRTASAGQRLALLARDRSCVLCNAHHLRCEAHHLVPFNASAKGNTDIDNLALVCGPCHRRLHDERLTLVRQASNGGGRRDGRDAPQGQDGADIMWVARAGENVRDRTAVAATMGCTNDQPAKKPLHSSASALITVAASCSASVGR